MPNYAKITTVQAKRRWSSFSLGESESPKTKVALICTPSNALVPWFCKFAYSSVCRAGNTC